MKTSYSSKTLVVVLLYCTFCTGKYVMIPGENRYWRVGETLTIYCVEQGGISQAKPQFNFTYSYAKSKTTNPFYTAKFINIVNDTAAEFRVPNITADWNGARLYCYNNSKLPSAFYQTIYVGHLPEGIQFSLNKSRLYNKSVVSLTWTPLPSLDNDTRFSVTHTALYRIERGKLARSICAKNLDELDILNITSSMEFSLCPENNCTFELRSSDYSDDDGIILIIRSKNNVGSRTFCQFIKPNDIPEQWPPVSEIQVLYSTNDDSEYLGLYKATAYVLPPTQKFLGYEFELVCEQASIRYRDTTHNPFCNLQKLPAYSNCTLSVRCAPRGAEVKLNIIGFWSEFNNYTFMTPPAVPTRFPEICSACFSQSLLDHNRRTVAVYFKELPETAQRGERGVYRVRYTKLSVFYSYNDTKEKTSCNVTGCSNPPVILTNDAMKEECKSADTTQLVFEGDQDADYCVSISSQTLNTRGSGYNERLQEHCFRIPKIIEINDIHKPMNITVIFDKNDGLHHISWQTSEKTVNEQNFTVVWCEKEEASHECKTSVQWLHVNSSVRQVPIAAGPEGSVSTLDNYQKFRFGVASVDVENGSTSGIIWNRCIFRKDLDLESIPAPKIEIAHNGSDSVTLHVSVLDCSSVRLYVYGYKISYILCKSDCSDETSASLINSNLLSWPHEFFQGNKKEIHVKDLSPSSKYLFVVTPLSARGPGATGTAIPITTLAIQSILSYIIASAVPAICIILLVVIFCFWKNIKKIIFPCTDIVQIKVPENNHCEPEKNFTNQSGYQNPIHQSQNLGSSEYPDTEKLLSEKENERKGNSGSPFRWNLKVESIDPSSGQSTPSSSSSTKWLLSGNNEAENTDTPRPYDVTMSDNEDRLSNSNVTNIENSGAENVDITSSAELEPDFSNIVGTLFHDLIRHKNSSTWQLEIDNTVSFLAHDTILPECEAVDERGLDEVVVNRNCENARRIENSICQEGVSGNGINMNEYSRAGVDSCSNTNSSTEPSASTKDYHKVAMCSGSDSTESDTNFMDNNTQDSAENGDWDSSNCNANTSSLIGNLIGNRVSDEHSNMFGMEFSIFGISVLEPVEESGLETRMSSQETSEQAQATNEGVQATGEQAQATNEGVQATSEQILATSESISEYTKVDEVSSTANENSSESDTENTHSLISSTNSIIPGIYDAQHNENIIADNLTLAGSRAHDIEYNSAINVCDNNSTALQSNLFNFPTLLDTNNTNTFSFFTQSMQDFNLPQSLNIPLFSLDTILSPIDSSQDLTSFPGHSVPSSDNLVSRLPDYSTVGDHSDDNPLNNSDDDTSSVTSSSLDAVSPTRADRPSPQACTDLEFNPYTSATSQEVNPFVECLNV